jgi:hypothetical protein
VLSRGSLNPHLRRENRIKTIHSSLAIEHNSLSLDQVTAILDGKRILGNPNEIREVKNAYDAYEMMLAMINRSSRGEQVETMASLLPAVLFGRKSTWTYFRKQRAPVNASIFGFEQFPRTDGNVPGIRTFRCLSRATWRR